MCGVKCVVPNEVYIVHYTGADAGSGSGLGLVRSVLCAVCSVQCLPVKGKYYLNFFLTGSALSPLLFKRVSNKITKLGSIWDIQQVAFPGQ